MASAAATIADALKVDIDAHSWPVSLSTHREYMTSISRSSLGTDKRVSVFPYTHQSEKGAGRGNTTSTHGVAVVLRSAASPEITAEMDALVETLEAMAGRYVHHTIAGGTPDSALPILGDQLYDLDQLADARLFVGGIIINYQTRT